MSGLTKAQIRHERWWLNKRCRLAWSRGEFKKVVKVETVGPPSYVYGVAFLHFEDGSRDAIATQAFRPRKIDVEVEP